MLWSDSAPACSWPLPNQACSQLQGAALFGTTLVSAQLELRHVHGVAGTVDSLGSLQPLPEAISIKGVLALHQEYKVRFLYIALDQGVEDGVEGGQQEAVRVERVGSVEQAVQRAKQLEAEEAVQQLNQQFLEAAAARLSQQAEQSEERGAAAAASSSAEGAEEEVGRGNGSNRRSSLADSQDTNGAGQADKTANPALPALEAAAADKQQPPPPQDKAASSADHKTGRGGADERGEGGREDESGEADERSGQQVGGRGKQPPGGKGDQQQSGQGKQHGQGELPAGREDREEDIEQHTLMTTPIPDESASESTYQQHVGKG